MAVQPKTVKNTNLWVTGIDQKTTTAPTIEITINIAAIFALF
ncbi:MAG: hypothetical protein AAFZ15_02460 [Bacteroidota bacterium]